MYIITEVILNSITPFASHVLQGTTELATEVGLFLGALSFLGIDANDLFEVALQAAFVYIGALILVRLGEKRLLGKSTAFDFILGIILGSVLSRGVTGFTPLVLAITAGLVFIVLHWLLAFLSIKSERIDTLAKGRSTVLVRDDEVDWKAMHELQLGDTDLMAAVRLKINSSSLDDVEEARLERGERSASSRRRGPGSWRSAWPRGSRL